MQNNRRNPEHESSPETRAHETFLELCALSTSGDLSPEEQKDLQAHVARCSDCRQALKEFEAAADIGMPLLHSHLSALDPSDAVASAIETATTTASSRVAQQDTTAVKGKPAEKPSALGFLPPTFLPRTQVNWHYVWVPFAAAVMLTATLGIYSYEYGRHKGQQSQRVVTATPIARDSRVEALEQEISDFGHERQNLKNQLAQRDGTIAELHRQLAEQSAALAETRKVQDALANAVQADQNEKQEVAQEGNALTQRIDSLRASLQKTETELDSLKQQRSQDQLQGETLSAQIKDLHGQLHDREQELGQEQDLLAHDRDIRELMGARDLYIAEVYDVARDGQTQKPYGRVFYTKGKSLVFYAYDLDQQAGVKSASTFQAWGSRGLDRERATNLGVFYEDNLAKKRWVLKFDDPQKLEQIDAVFVTVEPSGGSHKPSGKPLLFASLKIEPNHP